MNSHNDSHSNNCACNDDANSVEFSANHFWVHPLCRKNISIPMGSVKFINMELPVRKTAKSFACQDAFFHICPQFAKCVENIHTFIVGHTYALNNKFL